VDGGWEIKQRWRREQLRVYDVPAWTEKLHWPGFCESGVRVLVGGLGGGFRDGVGGRGAGGGGRRGRGDEQAEGGVKG